MDFESVQKDFPFMAQVIDELKTIYQKHGSPTRPVGVTCSIVEVMH